MWASRNGAHLQSVKVILSDQLCFEVIVIMDPCTRDLWVCCVCAGLNTLTLAPIGCPLCPHKRCALCRLDSTSSMHPWDMKGTEVSEPPIKRTRTSDISNPTPKIEGYLSFESSSESKVSLSDPSSLTIMNDSTAIDPIQYVDSRNNCRRPQDDHAVHHITPQESSSSCSLILVAKKEKNLTDLYLPIGRTVHSLHPFEPKVIRESRAMRGVAPWRLPPSLSWFKKLSDSAKNLKSSAFRSTKSPSSSLKAEKPTSSVHPSLGENTGVPNPLNSASNLKPYLERIFARRIKLLSRRRNTGVPIHLNSTANLESNLQEQLPREKTAVIEILNPAGELSGSTHTISNKLNRGIAENGSKSFEYGTERKGSEYELPFEKTEIIERVFSQENTSIQPEITVMVEGNFTFAGDQWTFFQQNQFSVSCQFSLRPNTVSTLFVYPPFEDKGRRILSFALKLSSALLEPQSGLIHSSHPSGASRLLKIKPKDPKFYGSSGQAQDEIVLFNNVQFRSVTANNGIKNLAQRFYHLKVELHADVGTDKGHEHWVKIASRVSAPLVVRGRSPSHFSDSGGISPVHLGLDFGEGPRKLRYETSNHESKSSEKSMAAYHTPIKGSV